MKTKTEIKNKIKELRSQKKLAKIIKDKQGKEKYLDVTKQEIHALEWVLGYKSTEYYFCSRCFTIHDKEICPKCRG
jgi:recombinational DNA repair protein RecR